MKTRWVLSAFVSVAAFWSLSACGDQGQSGDVAANLTADSIACAAPADGARLRQVAKRCAEEFVRRQGYTSAPAAVDSSTAVYEFIEPANTWQGVLKWRHNTLSPDAIAICDLHPTWYEVVFASPDPKSPHGRAVRVRKDFGLVEMVHQGFILAALDDSTVACTRVH